MRVRDIHTGKVRNETEAEVELRVDAAEAARRQRIEYSALADRVWGGLGEAAVVAATGTPVVPVEQAIAPVEAATALAAAGAAISIQVARPL